MGSDRMKELFSLEGRTAAVTGAGGVLFGTVAEGLGAMGVRIAAMDIRLEEAKKTADSINSSGGEAMACEIDVLEEKSALMARDAAVDRFGGVDILINGAGGNHPKAVTNKEQNIYFSNLEIGGFKFAFDLNLLGTVIPSKVFAEHFVSRGEGVIINTSSMSADTPLSRVPAYSAAKAAISNFTKWLAADMAMNHSPRIRVNEIRPGFFPTLQNADLISKTPGTLTESRGKDILGGTPMGRYGKPEELLGAVIYLCSPSASFTTGASIAVDGGFGAFSGV